MSTDFMPQNAWESENIVIKKDNEAAILRKFIIYDDSNLIQTPLLKIIKTADFITEIKKSEIDTGIMISNLKINNVLIYLFILDDTIFIIKGINLTKFLEYFNEHLDSLIFNTPECKKDFNNTISTEDQISNQPSQFINKSKTINDTILKEIIKVIINKSQYRTIKMRQEILPDKYKSTNAGYKIDDLFIIQANIFHVILINQFIISLFQLIKIIHMHNIILVKFII